MEHKFVQFTVDVGAKRHPGAVLRYRAYINDELFTERNWIWTDTYLKKRIRSQRQVVYTPYAMKQWTQKVGEYV